MSQLLLYDLFQEIRNDQQPVAPGLEEYYLFLELLRHKTVIIHNFSDLAFALETIWLKSHQHKDKFRQSLRLRREALMQLAENLGKPSIEMRDADKNPVAGAAAGEPEPVGVQQAGEEKSKLAEPGAEQQIQALQDDAGSYTETSFSLGSQQTGPGRNLQLHAPAEHAGLLQTPFLFTHDYFPVKNRSLQQAWRSLKNKSEGRDLPEIDIPKTILHTTRKGFFPGLQFEKETINQLALFIFIDRSDTMAAVEEFGNELCHAANQSQTHAAVTPWYFFNLPKYKKEQDDYFVFSNDLTRSAGLRKLFGRQSKRNIVVLVYSDAGAFKENAEEDRLAETERFVTFLNRNAGYTAWLNPAPKNRWKDSNAEKIREMIPMFDTTRTDVESAIDALKGKIIQAAQPNTHVTA